VTAAALPGACMRGTRGGSHGEALVPGLAAGLAALRRAVALAAGVGPADGTLGGIAWATVDAGPGARRPSPHRSAERTRKPSPHPVGKHRAQGAAGSTGPGTDPGTSGSDPSGGPSGAWDAVSRVQDGDTGAFAEIYDQYGDTVFRYIYYRVGTRALAEDLMSETFLRALRRIGSVTFQGRDLGAWLVTIARNLIADHYKSGRYRLEIATADMLDTDAEDHAPEAKPEAAALDRLNNEVLIGAVRKLGAEQQECIMLRFLQGLSVTETAQIMGKNDGAIKALQYRAVRSLGRLLPEGFTPW
jgi:RNA polymerase sigma-70 factor (ECF subfamily)